MKVIIANNPVKREMAPANAILFWSKTAAELPAGWTLYNSASDAFIMGTNIAGISTTKAGSLTHVHTMPDTDSAGAHSHNGDTTAGDNSIVKTAHQIYSGGTNSYTKHAHPHVTTTISSLTSNHSHKLNNSDSANNNPPYIRFYLMKTTSIPRPVPKGAIAIWPNSLASIPNGWRLCDGSTQEGITVPDIRDRFIYIPSSDTDQNTTGGSSSHGHSLSAGTQLDAGHTHTYQVGTIQQATENKIMLEPGGAAYAPTESHVHSLTSSGSFSNYKHKHNISSGLVAKEVLPSFMKLYYIIKVR